MRYLKVRIKNWTSYTLDLFKYSFSKEKIVFHNWWRASNIEDYFFPLFIQNWGIPMRRRFIFTSVFGNKNPLLKYFRGKKIFFTGENVEKTTINFKHTQYANHLLNQVDFAMGFSYLNHPNYLRFPLWIFYFIKYSDTLEDIRRKIDEINNPAHRLNRNRTKFASLISRHDMSGVRSKIYNSLQKLGNIECAGGFMKNTNELQEKFEDNKIEYLKQFRFNICPENSSAKGYITEKIFESIISGCIPIYWGGGTKEDIEPEIINPNAFLYYEEGKEDELLAKVEKLTSDEQAYREFCEISPFKEGAAEVIWGWICELEDRLRALQK